MPKSAAAASAMNEKLVACVKNFSVNPLTTSTVITESASPAPPCRIART